MKSIICFSVVLIIACILMFMGPVNCGRGGGGGTRSRKSSLSSLCNTNGSVDPSFLTKASQCVNSSMDATIKAGLGTCLTQNNKSPTNPNDIKSVVCDRKLFRQIQLCLRTQLQGSSGNPSDANKQVRTAINKFTGCLNQQKK